MHVSVKCGSTNDPKGLEGISHFLEHIKFGDTLKKESMLEEAESIGAILNAYTSFEETSYYIECGEEFYEKAIEIILNTVFLTNFSELAEKNINEERKIILQEKSLYQNIVGIDKSFVGLMLDNDNKYTRPVIGTCEGINNITKRDLDLYNEKFYSLNNSFIIINSSKKIQTNVVTISDKLLKSKHILKTNGLKHKSLYLNEKTVELSTNVLPKTSHSLYVEYMNTKYNSGDLYFKSFDMCNENFFTLKFVDYLVYKVLYRSLRKNKQLVYTVNCNSYGHKDIGVTNIKFSSTHEVSDVLNVIFIQLNENVINISTKDYLNIKKNFIKMSKHSILKDPSHAIHFEKLNVFMKRRVHFEEYIEHIKNLNRDSFSGLCKNILNRSNVSISATYNNNSDQYHIENITKIVQTNSY
jgi:predicted Zn-dependent peptidase